MKRIFIFIFCLIFPLCLISGCGNEGGKNQGLEAHPVENAEFKGYEKNIVSVLQSANIKLNNITDNVNTAIKPKFNIENSTRTAEGIDSLYNFLMSSESKEAIDNNIYLVDVLEQVFSLGIVVGHAMSWYHNETNFYGITSAIQIPNPDNIDNIVQYVKAYKQGNHEITVVYTESPSNKKMESINYIDLEYKSKTDYNFKIICKHFSSNSKVFCSGNGNLAYTKLQIDEDYALACFSGSNFNPCYTLQSREVVSQALNLVDDEFNSIDINTLKNIKDETKHTISSEEWSATLAYYFPYSGENKLPRISYQYNEDDTVLTRIIFNYADDYDETVLIPNTVKYLSDNLLICINSPAVVKSLFIPENIIGIKQSDTHNEYSPTEAKNFKPRILIMNEDSNNENDKIDIFHEENYPKGTFESFKVSANNPIFAISPNGHLKTKDNQYVFCVNAPLDEKELTVDASTSLIRPDGIVYLPVKKLFSELENLTIKFNSTRDSFDLNQFLENFHTINNVTFNFPEFTTLPYLNYFQLREAQIFNDITMNFTGSNYTVDLNISSNNQHNLNIHLLKNINMSLSSNNTTGNIYTDYLESDAKANLLINNQQLISISQPDQMQVHFKKDTINYYFDELEYTYIFEQNTFATILKDCNVDEIIIPASLGGIPITSFITNNKNILKSDKLKKITFPESMREIKITSKIEDTNFLMELKNVETPIKEQIQLNYNNGNISFKVKQGEKTEVFKNFATIRIKDNNGNLSELINVPSTGYITLSSSKIQGATIDFEKLKPTNVSEFKYFLKDINSNTKYLIEYNQNDFSWEATLTLDTKEDLILVGYVEEVKSVEFIINGTNRRSISCSIGDVVIVKTNKQNTYIEVYIQGKSSRPIIRISKKEFQFDTFPTIYQEYTIEETTTEINIDLNKIK